MPKIAYIHKEFRGSTLELISRSNSIIGEYARAGYSLTLRQLYYQLVARAILPNKQSEYKRLGSIINDARMAGMVDWSAIVDRTRSLRGNSHWDDPAEIMESAVQSYLTDKWATQPRRVEAWIEKDALVGVIQRICKKLDIDYFSCRGYASASSVWEAGQRMRRYGKQWQEPLILFLSDHDPSGMDMARDVEDRLRIFSGGQVKVKRIALTMDQIEEYDPPPNPAKTTDSRYQEYLEQYGDESWELDALEPSVLSGLIEDEVLAVRDENIWIKAVKKERDDLTILQNALSEVRGYV